MIGRDYGTTEGEMQALEEMRVVGFAEDEAMIEAVQRMQDRDPRSTAERSVKAEAPGVQARRLVQRWMERD